MTKKSVKFDMNPLLSGPSLKDRVFSGSPFRLVPLEDIDVDPDQPRRVFDEQALSDLAESILEYGVLCPILVRPSEGGTYRLVSGERRFRASKRAGLEAIPAIMDVGSEDEARTLLKQLVENLQRQNLNSLEMAMAVGQLRDQFSLSIRDIAQKLGISKSAVQRSLDVLKLPEDLQIALGEGKSESKILLLSQVADRSRRGELLAVIDEISRQQLIEEISKLDEKKTEVSHRGTLRPVKKLSPEDSRVVQEIQRAVGLKVDMSRNSQNSEKGKLTIEFYSSSDLEEIFERLTSS